MEIIGQTPLIQQPTYAHILTKMLMAWRHPRETNKISLHISEPRLYSGLFHNLLRKKKIPTKLNYLVIGNMSESDRLTQAHIVYKQCVQGVYKDFKH